MKGDHTQARAGAVLAERGQWQSTQKQHTHYHSSMIHLLRRQLLRCAGRQGNNVSRAYVRVKIMLMPTNMVCSSYQVARCPCTTRRNIGTGPRRTSHLAAVVATVAGGLDLGHGAIPGKRCQADTIDLCCVKVRPVSQGVHGGRQRGRHPTLLKDRRQFGLRELGVGQDPSDLSCDALLQQGLPRQRCERRRGQC